MSANRSEWNWKENIFRFAIRACAKQTDWMLGNEDQANLDIAFQPCQDSSFVFPWNVFFVLWI